MAEISFPTIFLLVLCNSVDVNSFKLKQLLVLSRHNVRTPLTSNLEKFSPKLWTKWDAKVAELTEKGVLLESSMAEYFSSWFSEENLIKGCPKDQEVLIYANTKQRTIESAKTFAESAFKNCNVTVHFNKNIEVMDFIFNPIFHNTSKLFLNEAFKEMQNKLDSLNLKEAFIELCRILRLKDSNVCKEESLCDLSNIDNSIDYVEREEPNVRGPLFYGNSIVDSFIMSYYEGKPMEEVAWGQITTHEQWRLLVKISRENQNVRFNLTSTSKDLAGPLLDYMFKIFRNGTPKFTLLMGHDSNLNPVINALGFKWFELPGQYEPFPIGGKLVFQRWIDDNSNEFLKVEYIYQTFSDMRNGKTLSLLNPPQKVLLELKSCNIDVNGFCPWNDFLKLDFGKDL